MLNTSAPILVIWHHSFLTQVRTVVSCANIKALNIKLITQCHPLKIKKQYICSILIQGGAFSLVIFFHTSPKQWNFLKRQTLASCSWLSEFRHKTKTVSAKMLETWYGELKYFPDFKISYSCKWLKDLQDSLDSHKIFL